ncbi:uncharacterized protein DUF3899 [Mycoplasmopsis mustelae]|uniref:Uncharacterized protein DUF3899 n=1 Tax=Mycoplasmopsis mustelae TaxID=171289 RepID=A0A4R7UCD8_9BACT|nr:DUF3899 domain-containing protein [Mycoplasmopsis mustelae]TDV23548.1 uncharacterized protein DUF3899 [Mycoplasmopsis mustelae]
MNKWFKKFMIHTKYQLQSTRFWIINIIYALIFSIIVVVWYFTKGNKQLLDSFTAASIIIFCLVLFILIFKWGFLERTIQKFNENQSISKKYSEERKLAKMDAIERKIYLEQKQNKHKQKHKPKSNYVFYLNLFIYLIVLIIIIILNYV